MIYRAVQGLPTGKARSSRIARPWVYGFNIGQSPFPFGHSPFMLPRSERSERRGFSGVMTTDCCLVLA